MPIPIPESTLPGLQPYTIELCAKTAEPRHAYVVFEMKKHRAFFKDGKWLREWTTGLAWLNIQDQPNQAWLVTEYILAQGMKIIGYGNIPSAGARDSKTQAIYRAHAEGGAGSNAYDKIRLHCDTFIGQRDQVNKEILGYKAELGKMRKELEEITTAKKEVKSNANQNR